MNAEKYSLEMYEDTLLQACFDLINLFGLRAVHFRPAMKKNRKWYTPIQGHGVGYPDLTIIGPRGIMWRELKREKAKLTPQQEMWVTYLRNCGQNVGTWRPSDLRGRFIEMELRNLAHDRREK